MMNYNIQKDANVLTNLKCGDIVYLSGTIYTARDAAHKKIDEHIKEFKTPPFDLTKGAIYYAGPCPAKEGQVIGSIGPTTASRCDVFTPTLLDNGLKFMIGKGERSKSVVDSIIKNKAVYFVGIGGAGALYASLVKKAKVLLYPELLAEAVYELEVENFPVIVAIDSKGESIYK